LRAALGVARTLDVPVVVNRHRIGDDRVETYCTTEGIPILLAVPFD